MQFRFMGEDAPEYMRAGRVYDATGSDTERIEWLRLAATSGVVDCPAHDERVAAMQERGYMPSAPELVPNPDGPGRIGLWKLTGAGREMLHRLESEEPKP